MELLQRLFYTFVGTASFLYFVVKVALGYWKRRGILHEKPKKPWGHLKGVGRKRHIAEVLQTLYEKYKGQAPFIGFYAWLKPMLLILDIDSINYILNKDSKYFMDRGLYSNTNDDPLTENLLHMDGIEWQHLNLKTKALQWPEKMSNIFTALLKVQQTFDKSLQEKLTETDVVYNITQLVEGFNIDVISSLAFGLEGDSLRYKETQFHKMCKNYTQQNNNIYKAYLAFSFPRLARLLQYRLYSPEATSYFQKLINDKLYEREYQRSQQTPYDFLQIWSDSRKISTSMEAFKKLDCSEIAAQAFTFIPAGLEACTTTVSCCLYELALQPDIQDKARCEIIGVLAKYQNKLTLDGLKEMVYLKQILNETLRKHSPYPFLLRLTTKDYELPNSIFMLRKGNHLIIPTSSIHNDATYYKQPEKFDPDHFHSTNVQNRPLCAFLPFGMGPRSCMAQQFIQQQMLVCLVTLLKRYSFTPCQETIIPLTYDNGKLLKKPKKDIKLMIKKL
ncbi:putative cytochrome P450 6u1 [Lucilia cuprina]|uniref:Putative cytochrome P450 6u1 n=1 Tax=Lucilia cuprina TaxID=7375 RepID=A0A0L0BW32_LUCCU|nr:putative cytochrome P450 6u1 [Lucilia cuprina]KNC23434.1 putative cytochrome P450 6u1 [Lucilia cuprina]